MGDRWTHDTAVDFTHSLVPRLAERAGSGERLRRLPEATIADCTDADLFILALKGHVVYDWDRTAQLAGKLELGVEPGPADML